jgi:hypothetical protein
MIWTGVPKGRESIPPLAQKYSWRDACSGCTRAALGHPPKRGVARSWSVVSQPPPELATDPTASFD